MDDRLLELQRVLDLDAPPRRLECFDISHTGGEKAVASCVVFNEQGPLKSAYRKFNIDGITPGDDYAAISQAVARRFARVKSGRSEEHTSELQSLMRISYAVFCLKKKKKTKQHK